MILDRVTVTGADDSIDHAELVKLSAEFPFVEWGILASASNVGTPRFPTLSWMAGLRETYLKTGTPRTSLHLCGRWVRLLLMGDIDQLVVKLAACCGRIQLNFHAERNACEPAACLKALKRLQTTSLYGSGLQFIFQIDGARGNQHLESIWEEMDGNGRIDAVGLFDVSGGAGIVPAEWPKPQYMQNDCDYEYHGYAGGLSPDNLDSELKRISAVAGDCRIWIDCESKVRSNNDQQFDLAKVRAFLEVARPWVV